MADVEDVCAEHKVVLIGDHQVGKSSLFMRFKTGRFMPVESQTRKEAEHMKKWTQDGEELCVSYQLWASSCPCKLPQPAL